jgi:hypothetical protein
MMQNSSMNFQIKVHNYSKRHYSYVCAIFVCEYTQIIFYTHII